MTPMEGKEYEKKPKGAVQNARRPRAYAVTSMTAAAGKQNDGNDDQPKGAVFKKIAKAVIHNRSSKNRLGSRYLCSSVIIL